MSPSRAIECLSSIRRHEILARLGSATGSPEKGRVPNRRALCDIALPSPDLHGGHERARGLLGVANVCVRSRGVAHRYEWSSTITGTRAARSTRPEAVRCSESSLFSVQRSNRLGGSSPPPRARHRRRHGPPPAAAARAATADVRRTSERNSCSMLRGCCGRASARCSACRTRTEPPAAGYCSSPCHGCRSAAHIAATRRPCRGFRGFSRRGCRRRATLHRAGWRLVPARRGRGTASRDAASAPVRARIAGLRPCRGTARRRGAWRCDSSCR